VTKYHVEKFDQWIAIKKRSEKEKAELKISQDMFYSFINENKKLFIDLAEQHLTPYVTRIDEALSYQITNIQVAGRPRPITGVRGRPVNDGGSVLEFTSTREACKFGYSRRQVAEAIKSGKVYKNYIWEKRDG